jgi:ketosteroid isomerase-like protein
MSDSVKKPDAPEISIWQVLCRYCHLVDRGEMTQVVELFDPEGTVVFPGKSPAKGHGAILEAYESWRRGAREPTVWLRHQVTTPSIVVDGDRATAMCYLTADFLLRKRGRVQALTGRYEDELVRKGDRWLFWRREILIHSRVDWGEPLP